MNVNLLMLLLLFPIACFSQGIFDSIPIADGGNSVEFNRVLDAVGNQDALYTKSKIWIFDTFNNAKSVIKLDDKASGYITGHGYLTYSYIKHDLKRGKKEYSFRENNGAEFSFKIFVKDKKAKLIISDIIIRGIVSFMNYKWNSEAIKYTKKQVNSQKLSDKVQGQSKTAEYEALYAKIDNLYRSFQMALNKKSEADF